MLSKTWNPDDEQFTVTFDLPGDLEIDRAAVVGEFNDWNPHAHPMERTEDGRWVATVAFEPGGTHRFRYQIGDESWENDWSADDYVPNEFGGADSVLVVPAAPVRPPAAKKPAKQAARSKAVKKSAASERAG